MYTCASRGSKTWSCQVVLICGAGGRLCFLEDPHCSRRRLQFQVSVVCT